MDRTTFRRLVRKIAIMHPHQPGVPLIHANPRGDAEKRRRLEELLGRKPPARGSVKHLPPDLFFPLLDKIKLTLKGLGEDLKRQEAKVGEAKTKAEVAVRAYKHAQQRYNEILADLQGLQDYYMSGGFRSREGGSR